MFRNVSCYAQAALVRNLVPHFQVLCQFFSMLQIPKTVQPSTGKIQPNAEPSIKRIELVMPSL